jgi:hypothetical protein
LGCGERGEWFAGGGVAGGFGAEIIFASGDGNFDEAADVGGGGVVERKGAERLVEDERIGVELVERIKVHRRALLNKFRGEGSVEPSDQGVEKAGMKRPFACLPHKAAIEEFVDFVVDQTGTMKRLTVFRGQLPPELRRKLCGKRIDGVGHRHPT